MLWDLLKRSGCLQLISPKGFTTDELHDMARLIGIAYLVGYGT